MKAISLIWATGSVLLNVIISIYIFARRNMPSGIENSYDYMNEHVVIFRGHWQAEYLVMTALFICALQWAITTKKVWWTIATAGLAITLGLYPTMLGGYFNTSVEIMNAANQQAVYVFGMGSGMFFIGMIALYLNDRLLPKWLRLLAVALSSIVAVAFMAITFGFLSWDQFYLFGPAASLVYFINGWYGYRYFKGLKNQRQTDSITVVPVDVQVSP